MQTPESRLLRETLGLLFVSANESDSNGEAANVVDGLFAIARAMDRIATAYARVATAQESFAIQHSRANDLSEQWMELELLSRAKRTTQVAIDAATREEQ